MAQVRTSARTAFGDIVTCAIENLTAIKDVLTKKIDLTSFFPTFRRLRRVDLMQFYFKALAKNQELKSQKTCRDV